MLGQYISTMRTGEVVQASGFTGDIPDTNVTIDPFVSLYISPFENKPGRFADLSLEAATQLRDELNRALKAARGW